MMSRRLFLLLLFVSNLITAAPAQQKPGAEPLGRLKFALILTRHGVRSPTWTNERLNDFAKEPWPTWEVAPGMLTPHGKTLMTFFGAYYREYFAQQGLVSAKGCSDAAQVYVRPDTDQRTLETGRAITDGMWPGCKVDIHSLGQGVHDELFHSSGNTSDRKLARAALAGRIGDDPSGLLPAYQLPLTTMHRVLLACVENDCTIAEKRRLLDIAPVLAEGSGDHLLELKGPLFTGATFAENFQLEYLNGMPMEQVGWGRLDENSILALMAIHTAASDILQRTPAIAKAQASNILLHILRTMEQAEQQQAVSGSIGATNDNVVFLIGHDTNITGVSAILDTHWLIKGYQRDDAAPGGALIFELWQNLGQEDSVRVYYTVQTPTQMRNSVPLSLETPPARAVLFLPGCSQPGDGAPCRWSAFKKLVEESTYTEPAQK